MVEILIKKWSSYWNNLNANTLIYAKESIKLWQCSRLRARDNQKSYFMKIKLSIFSSIEELTKMLSVKNYCFLNY